MSSRALLFLISLFALLGCADPSFELKEVPHEQPQSEVPRDLSQNKPSTPTPIPSLEPVSPPSTVSQVKETPKAELFETDQIQLHASEVNWKKIADEDGVLAYQERNPKSEVVSFRGETTMPVSIQKISAVLSDFSNRKEWVDGLIESRLIFEKDQYHRIEYNHTQVPWPFQDRDFVYALGVKVNPNPAVMVVEMQSIEDSREPPHDGIVRGEILYSYYYMKELPGASPSTRVVVEMAVNPKGSIPLWLVNLTQKRWPHNTLMALRRLASKPNLVIPKQISDYFNSKNRTTSAHD